MVFAGPLRRIPDALGLAVPGAHVLVLAVQTSEVDLRWWSAAALVVRMLLPVPGVASSHAVVSRRLAPQARRKLPPKPEGRLKSDRKGNTKKKK